MEFKNFSEFGGESWRILRFPDEFDKRWSAFNPSISWSPVEGYTVLFRSSNYFLDPATTGAVLTAGSIVKSRMWLANLDKDWRVVPDSLREIDFSSAGVTFQRGAEDGRLYWVDDHWELTAGLKEPSIYYPRIGRFRVDNGIAKLITIYEDGDLYEVEKNWMAPANKPSTEFDYIYNPISIYKTSVGPLKVREPSELVRDVRGGSQLWWVDGWGYLAIIHEAIVKEHTIYVPRYFSYKKIRVRTYIHRFARYDRDGILIGLSEKFKLSDARIEFAAGLVVSGDDVIVSYGYKDVASYLGKIKLDIALSMIKEV